MAKIKLNNGVVERNDEIQFSFTQICFNKILILILFLVHFVYTLFTIIYTLLNNCYKHVQIYCVPFGSSKMSSESITSLSDKLKTFSKTPHHLAVIVGSEQVSYIDFGKIILWCLSAEISHISFYNNKNEINPHLLYQTICQQSKDSLLRIKWGASFNDDIKRMAKISINGYKWQPMLQVNLFNPTSGIDCLLEVTKHFCQDGVYPFKIDISDVDRKIQGQMCIPDPDLAIVCSEVKSTFGFLPWHLRVTEIQNISTHHNLTLQTFLDALESYSNCEQRFGK